MKFCWYLFAVIAYKAKLCSSINWQRMRCAAGDAAAADDGPAPRSRFPWLGVVQHSFYIAEKTRYAVTTGVLIHPGYVMASAEDIGKIAIQQIANSTKFIVWGKGGEKYALDVYEYVLHPDYLEKLTVATVALLKLRTWHYTQRPAPVDPICLPLKGIGDFDNLHAVKFNDADNELKKEIYRVNYVPDKECAEFYYRAELSYEKMSPRHPTCASVEADSQSCVWDNGVLLITRMNFGYWTLLGFGTRGPGCGAPARFASLHRMLEWLDEVVSGRPLLDVPPGYNAFYLRQLSPVHLTLYKADVQLPTDYGQCQKGPRGSVLYKDNTEIASNSNAGQGFYFVSVYSLSQFSCAVVRFNSMTRSNTAMWVEHSCHQQVAGMARGMQAPDNRKYECFIYYKSVAFIEFRFTFSFKATISMTVYGVPLIPGALNPWLSSETTDAWWPTERLIKDGYFYPYYFWFWSM